VTPQLLGEFTAFAAERGVPLDQAGYQASLRPIKENLKAFLARALYNDEGFWPTLHQTDPAFQQALRLMPQAIELTRTGRFENPLGNSGR
jgi:carboxyl-terminal processing protease